MNMAGPTSSNYPIQPIRQHEAARQGVDQAAGRHQRRRRLRQSDGLRRRLELSLRRGLWDGGVLVGVAPDLIYCKDTDGDGKADVRTKLYTGFGPR